MWLLIVPLIIVLVLCFAIGGLFAGVFWLLGSAWPLLLICLGAWMFWHEDGRYRRQRYVRGGWMSKRESRVATKQQPSGKSSDKAAASTSSNVARQLRQSELPIDVQVKVEQLRRKVDVLLGYADRFPPFSQDLYLVRQTLTDYLPRTLNAFLALPQEAVDRPLNVGGKTARQELKAQLDLLDTKLDDIAQDLQRQDADRLLANRRFLESRFGDRDPEVVFKDKPEVA
jgi:hypothetical protein